MKFCVCCKYIPSSPGLDFQERGAERLIDTVFSAAVDGGPVEGWLANRYSEQTFDLAVRYAKFRNATIIGNFDGNPNIGNGSETWNGKSQPFPPGGTSSGLTGKVSHDISVVGSGFLEPNFANRKLDFDSRYDLLFDVERTDNQNDSESYFLDNGTSNGTFHISCTSPNYFKERLEVTRLNTLTGQQVPRGAHFYMSDSDNPGGPRLNTLGPAQVENNPTTPVDRYTVRHYEPNPEGGRGNGVDPAFTCADVTWNLVEDIYTVLNAPGDDEYDSSPGFLILLDPNSYNVAGAQITADIEAVDDHGRNLGPFPRCNNLTGSVTFSANQMITAEDAMTEIETVIATETYGEDGSSGLAISDNTLPEDYSPVYYKRVRQRTVGGQTHKNWLDTVEGIEKKARFEVPSDHIDNGGTYFEIEYHFIIQEWSLDPDDTEVTETETEAETVVWDSSGDEFTEYVDLPDVPVGVNVLIGIKATRFKPHSKSVWLDV